MFDKKSYVKEKILTRLKTSKLYETSSQKSAINDLIDSLPNLDMIAYTGPTFEESVVGWLSFCKTVDSLLLNDKEVNLETFKDYLSPSEKVKSEPKGVTRSANVQYDYSKIDEDPQEKLKRLSELAEKVDIAEDVPSHLLTDEGLKVIGAVDRNDTSLNAVDVKVDIDKLMPIVEVEWIDLVNNVIKSPFTGTTQVAQVTSDVWMDIDTEQMFRVQVNKPKPKG